jgi:uncharacterized protein (TIGR02594 family)
MTNPIYEAAKKEIGVVEWKDGHNPRILQYFGIVGHDWVRDDETAWCAAFVGAVLEENGIKSTGMLTARSYLDFGEEVEKLRDVQQGDIVVLRRGKSNWQGHTGFVNRIEDGAVWVLGGNQRNMVSIAPYPLTRDGVNQVLGFRRYAIPEEAKVKEGKTRQHELLSELRKLLSKFKHVDREDD